MDNLDFLSPEGMPLVELEYDQPKRLLFTEDTREILEDSAYLASFLGSSTIRSFYILIAMFKSDTLLSAIISEAYELEFDCKSIIENLFTNQKNLEKVFGEEKAKELFSAFYEEYSKEDIEKYIFNKDKEESNEFKLFLDPKFADKFNSLEYSDTVSNIFTTLVEKLKPISEDNNCAIVDSIIFTYMLLSEKNSTARIFLDSLGIDVDMIVKVIYENCSEKFIENSEGENVFSLPNNIKSFCTDLTSKYKKGDVCDICSREEELKQIWTTSAKQVKRNSLIIGPAGCGKTAIVEALTMSIVNETCPKQFLGYKVLEVSAGSIISNTTLRGQLSSKVFALIDFISSRNDIILYIDEIHELIGSGTSSAAGDSMDIASLFKPVLARDNIVLIGSTTDIEYERFIKHDTAFNRRFKLIKVREPKYKELIPMIKLKVENMSKFHNVKISEAVLEYIAMSSYCFCEETSNPDKAISLCDSSLSIAKLNGHKTLTKKDVDEVNKRYITMFKNTSKSVKESIAYHEAGHYVIDKHLKSLVNYTPLMVSIIPHSNNAGVSISEIKDDAIYLHDRFYLEDLIIGYLAGRASEYHFTGTIEIGARSDLACAMNIARDMILKYGLDDEGDKEFFNISLLADDENTYDFWLSKSSIDYELLSEKQKVLISSKVKKIIDEAYEDTIKLVETYSAEIDKVAKALVKYGVMSSEQIEACIRGEEITSPILASMSKKTKSKEKQKVSV